MDLVKEKHLYDRKINNPAIMQPGTKLLIAALFIFSFFAFSFPKKKVVKQRTVYMLSGGFSAAYGHHTIKLTGTSAHVDTSFFPANEGFAYYIDSAYVKKNQRPSKDIETTLEVKAIYFSLMTLSRKTLIEYATASQKTDSAYFAQELIITENKHTDTLRYHIPVKLKEGGSKLDQFLFDLGKIFPFDGCRSSYKTFYKGQ
jgi:hypothetical protein